MGASGGLGLWTRRNWFLPVLALLLAIEWGFVRATVWGAGDRMAEGPVLVDLCLFVPLLHYLCYRRRLARRALLIRTAGLVFLGFYFASHLVPAEGQALIPALGWARLLGLAVLALIELWVLVAIVKLVFGGKANAAEVSATSGAPLWVARLMLVEARFWKWLWRLLSGGRGKE